MSTPVTPFGSVELALKDLLVRDYAPLTGLDERVGGDFPRDVDQWYIRIDKIPGGRTDSFEGDFIVDIDVFSLDYLDAEQIAHDIEGLLLAHGYHVVLSGGKRWVFDSVFQNVGVADRPWDGDDDTFRISATYAFTARRRAATSGPIPAPPGGGEEVFGEFAFEYTQSTPSTVWTIEHGLGYHPAGIQVVDSNGDIHHPVIVYLDENTVRLTLAIPVTGTAYLS